MLTAYDVRRRRKTVQVHRTSISLAVVRGGLRRRNSDMGRLRSHPDARPIRYVRRPGFRQVVHGAGHGRPPGAWAVLAQPTHAARPRDLHRARGPDRRSSCCVQASARVERRGPGRNQFHQPVAGGLCVDEDVDRLIADLGLQLGDDRGDVVVILDTLARAMPGSNENSSEHIRSDVDPDAGLGERRTSCVPIIDCESAAPRPVARKAKAGAGKNQRVLLDALKANGPWMRQKCLDFMAQAGINRNRRHEVIESLLLAGAIGDSVLGLQVKA